MTNEERVEILRQLETLTEEAAKAAFEARNDPKNKDWCVNWGDFHAVMLKWCLDVNGAEWVEVEYEEASPGNGKLRIWMREWLERRGAPYSFEVRFEW